MRWSKRRGGRKRLDRAGDTNREDLASVQGFAQLGVVQGEIAHQQVDGRGGSLSGGQGYEGFLLQ